MNAMWQQPDKTWQMADAGWPTAMVGVNGMPSMFYDMPLKAPKPPPLWRGKRKHRRRRVAEYVREGLRTEADRNQQRGCQPSSAEQREQQPQP